MIISAVLIVGDKVFQIVENYKTESEAINDIAEYIRNNIGSRERANYINVIPLVDCPEDRKSALVIADALGVEFRQ